MGKKCTRHRWKHVEEEGFSMGMTYALWLVHRCSKCGLETAGLKIKDLPRRKEKMRS